MTSLLGVDTVGLETACGRIGAVEPLEKDMEGEPGRGLGSGLALCEEDDSVESRFSQDEDLVVAFALNSKEIGRSRTTDCLPNERLIDRSCSLLSTMQLPTAVCRGMCLPASCVFDKGCEFDPGIGLSV